MISELLPSEKNRYQWTPMTSFFFIFAFLCEKKEGLFPTQSPKSQKKQEHKNIHKMIYYKTIMIGLEKLA